MGDVKDILGDRDYAVEQAGYMSIIGISLLYPIIELLEKIWNLESKGKSDVQVSNIENGYSSSIVLLSVVMLESYLARIKEVFIKNEPYITCKLGISHLSKTKKDKFPRDFIKIFIDGICRDELIELFIIRDVIAHNHVWEGRIIIGKNKLEYIKGPRKRPGYGNKDFDRLTIEKSKKTKNLNLNIFPTKIGKVDACAVLQKCMNSWNILN